MRSETVKDLEARYTEATAELARLERRAAQIDADMVALRQMLTRIRELRVKLGLV